MVLALGSVIGGRVPGGIGRVVVVLAGRVVVVANVVGDVGGGDTGVDANATATGLVESEGAPSGALTRTDCRAPISPVGARSAFPAVRPSLETISPVRARLSSVP
jgi:hypothetical protein